MPSSTLTPFVSSLFIYPVKSLQGLVVTQANMDALGLEGDRRFMLVDQNGQFMTQRSHAKLATIRTELSTTQLILHAPQHGYIQVPRQSPTPINTHLVSIWKHQHLVADDAGTEVAQWLSDYLGTACALVRIGSDFQRNVLKAAATSTDHFAFADGAPLLIASEASLQELNTRIISNGGTTVPMNRFRPNIVVSGCSAFAEDLWLNIGINDVALRNAGRSDRCLVTTTDQVTGERIGKEPLKTLAQFRRMQPAQQGAVYFGCNYLNTSKSGCLRVGDSVTIGAA